MGGRHQGQRNCGVRMTSDSPTAWKSPTARSKIIVVIYRYFLALRLWHSPELSFLCMHRNWCPIIEYGNREFDPLCRAVHSLILASYLALHFCRDHQYFSAEFALAAGATRFLFGNGDENIKFDISDRTALNGFRLGSD